MSSYLSDQEFGKNLNTDFLMQTASKIFQT